MSNSNTNAILSLPSDSVVTALLALSITTGLMSVIGSTMILVVLLRSPLRLRSIYRRLVFGMSCMDIVYSLSYVAAGLPVEKDTAGAWTRNAIGNRATCNIQGFMNYSGLVGSLLYGLMLSIYFVMVVVYSKREDAILKRIEPFFHAISIVIPLGLGIFLLVTDNYNDGGNKCWIAPFPLDCTSPNNDVDCIRGENAFLYRRLFYGFPAVSVTLIVILCMVRLLWFIRKQLKKMKSHGANKCVAKDNKKERKRMRSAPSQTGTNLHSNEIRRSAPRKSQNEIRQMYTQAMLYIASLILIFLFPLLWHIVRKGWLYFLRVTFVPLLGFFNFFIFIRPRVVMTMQSKPELSFLQACYTAITTKEVISPSARRASVEMSTRSSYTRTALRIVQEEDGCELDNGLESMGYNAITTKEVISPSARRGSVEMSTRRSCTQTALQIVQEEDACELDNELENMESDSPPDSTYRFEQLASDSVPNSCEAQEIVDPLNAIDDAGGALYMTKDYTNML